MALGEEHIRVMCGCESWAIKKTECQRTDAFELRCWRRTLRVPWTARRSNQSVLKEINPEYSLEGLMMKLKFQYFGHLMGRTNSLEKTLMLGKIEGKRAKGEGDRGWDGWMESLTQWTLNLSKLWERVKDREAWHGAVHGVAKNQTWPGDWTKTETPKSKQWLFFQAMQQPVARDRKMVLMTCLCLKPYQGSLTLLE